jgi:formylglycine-generating enzyme
VATFLRMRVLAPALAVVFSSALLAPAELASAEVVVLAPPASASAGNRGAQKGEARRPARKKPRAPRKHARLAAPETRRAPVEKPEPRHRTPSLSILPDAIRCPPDMVAAAGRFCIDRFESALADADTGAALSPYYPPASGQALALFASWSAAREAAPSGSLGHRLELPAPGLVGGRAVARASAGAVPSGYVSGRDAALACAAAGKRLCREAEWVTACRGERQTNFPYGHAYRQGACNVFREDHPARLLHGAASRGHLDPRLNLVEVASGPLLRKTGETATCASKWGDDAVFDMVGNLDEWIDDPRGTFVGGFYARATRAGCDARVSSHGASYFDYSTGIRCCGDPI